MQSTYRQNSPHKGGGLASLLVFITLIAATCLLWLNLQFVLDSLHFWSYQPTNGIQSIVERVGFTDKGTFSFYATRPQIDESQQFNRHCDRQEQNIAILGCYVDDRIFIYNVSDSRLDGIREVTASHEMLHAVYQRLPAGEKKSLNELLEAEYAKLAKDPAFSERMAFYARTEPGERDNELHSIIGTEMSNLSSGLEAHYAKYFKDRKSVVNLYDSYNVKFTSLEKRKKELRSKLDELAASITADKKKYNDAVTSLNRDINSFKQKADSGGYTSLAAFNADRQALSKRIDTANTLSASINTDVDTYEAIRKEYNDTVTQSQKLYQSIDSNLSPAPKV